MHTWQYCENFVSQVDTSSNVPSDFKALRFNVCTKLLGAFLLIVFPNQILLLKVDKLERQVEGLIQYDKEHWSRYVEQQKENNKLVFPRTDYYCGDRMEGQKIFNICKEEESKFKVLYKKQKHH